MAFLLAAVVLATFGTVLGHGFFGPGDAAPLTENPWVERGVGPDTVGWSLRHGDDAGRRPLVWLSHLLDGSLFGLGATGHHATSLFLHALNSALVLLLLCRITRQLAPSAFVAFAFALHPLAVEPLAWLARRQELLGGTFFLLAMGAYVSSVSSPSRGRKALALLCFALLLGVQPALASLPLVLLLLDRWPLARTRSHSAGKLVKEKLPYFVLAAVLLPFLAGSGDPSLPLGTRIAFAPVAALEILARTSWPLGLSYAYPHPALLEAGDSAAPGASTLVALGLMAAATVLALLAARRSPWVGVGWLWYLVTLLPLLGLLAPGERAFADANAYVPRIGLFVLLAWTGHGLVRRLPPARVPVLASAVLVLCAWGAGSHRRLAEWRTTAGIVQSALDQDEESYVAHDHLGVELARRGKLSRAVREHTRALELRAEHVDALLNLAEIAERRSVYDLATQHALRALQAAPGDARVHYELGELLHLRGRPVEAKGYLEEAARLEPDRGYAHARLGMVALELLEPELARQSFERALHVQPEGRPEPWCGLGFALNELGDAAGAEEMFQRAIEVEPDYPEAHTALGGMYADRGLWERAEEHLQHAVDVHPRFSDALYQLARVREHGGDLEDARELYRRAALKRPGFMRATVAHARLALATGDLNAAQRSAQLVLDLEPDHVQTLLILARVRSAREEYDVAIDLLRRAANVAPEDPGPQIELGLLQLQLGNLEPARRRFERVLRTAGEHPGALYGRGLVQLEEGAFAEAERTLARANELVPNDPAIRAALDTARANLTKD